MLFYEIESAFGRFSRELDQCVSPLSTKHGDQFRWIIFQSGNDLTAIAARCAKADRLRLEDGYIFSDLAQAQGRIQPGISSADDGDICA